MRAIWKKNKVISIKLDADLYSLAQMANDVACMQFFDIFNEKDEWDVDLNIVTDLFLVNVGNVVIQRLGVRSIPESEAVSKKCNYNHLFIKPHMNPEGVSQRGEFMWRGGDLIDVGENLEISSYYAPIVIKDLTVYQHRDLILKHEFTNMYGDKNVLNRLLKFKKEGINEEPMKKKVFPDL
ncbi:MAG: hypothetical protein CSA42_01025 [Gammaproteobacteria bacterium]|nr:MAG: hypothetical protein CSA42_01025 [Gammaproteobacteria bacterium]